MLAVMPPRARATPDGECKSRRLREAAEARSAERAPGRRAERTAHTVLKGALLVAQHRGCFDEPGFEAYPQHRISERCWLEYDVMGDIDVLPWTDRHIRAHRAGAALPISFGDSPRWITVARRSARTAWVGALRLTIPGGAGSSLSCARASADLKPARREGRRERIPKAHPDPPAQR